MLSASNDSLTGPLTATLTQYSSFKEKKTDFQKILNHTIENIFYQMDYPKTLFSSVLHTGFPDLQWNDGMHQL